MHAWLGCLFVLILMRSSGRKTQHLLDDIVNDQLTGNNHADMNNTSAGTPKEFSHSPTRMDRNDDVAKRPSRGFVLFVGFRQNHVSGLTKHAGKETGKERGTHTHQQFIHFGTVASTHVGEKRVKDSGKEIEGNLFSKCIRNLTMIDGWMY
jgi:hypothetical protein